MNITEFNKLNDAEKRHFYKCKQCGQWSISVNWMKCSFTKITNSAPISNMADRKESARHASDYFRSR